MTYGPPPGHRPPPGPPPQGPPPGYRPPPGYPAPQGPPPGYRPAQGPPPGYRPAQGQPGYPPPPQAPVTGRPPQPGPQQPTARPSEPSGVFAHDELIAPRSGKVGETLEGAGSFGLRAGWRVLSIEYPADDVFTDAGLSIPDGYASAIVGALFTNKGTEPIECVPSRGLCLIDSQDDVHLAAPATVGSHPGFRDGQVLPEETIAGHSFYLIPKDRGVRGVQWRDGSDKLTWLR